MPVDSLFVWMQKMVSHFFGENIYRVAIVRDPWSRPEFHKVDPKDS